MKSDYLFVYGTLLSSLNHPMHDILKSYAEPEGEGTIQAKLYDLGGYPGMVISNRSTDRVKGEIYMISASEKLFMVLDRYEGCCDEYPEPWQYHRKVVPVQTSDGSRVDAWVYLFNWDSAGHTYIESGDYLKYVQILRNEALF
jgi:gamma-glutamylcyclotransferase (GGCT)/AIG2-like uncharacterized protein YtfP